MDAKDSETPNKAPTVGKEQPCARRYSVNAMSVSGGVSVGFISGGCLKSQHLEQVQIFVCLVLSDF